MAPPNQKLVHKLQSARQLPTLPAVLIPLLKYLERPFDSQDMHQIVSFISQDESLAARCLQVANSHLFGSAREIDSVQAAVVTLGLERIHQIAISCTILKLLPARPDLSPSPFWAHSLGCALVAHEFAGRIGFPDTRRPTPLAYCMISASWHFWPRCPQTSPGPSAWLVPKEFPCTKPSRRLSALITRRRGQSLRNTGSFRQP
jgi:HD-like signal output (HDOD) protein